MRYITIQKGLLICLRLEGISWTMEANYLNFMMNFQDKLTKEVNDILIGLNYITYEPNGFLQIQKNLCGDKNV